MNKLLFFIFFFNFVLASEKQFSQLPIKNRSQFSQLSVRVPKRSFYHKDRAYVGIKTGEYIRTVGKKFGDQLDQAQRQIQSTQVKPLIDQERLESKKKYSDKPSSFRNTAIEKRHLLERANQDFFSDAFSCELVSCPIVELALLFRCLGIK